MSSDKNTKDNEDIFEGMEVIDIETSLNGNGNGETSDESDGFHISFHAVFGIVSLILIGCIIFFILRWGSSSVEVNTADIEPDQFDMENQDYYIYPDPELMANHPDDGENNILFIGNGILTIQSNGKSLIDSLKEKIDGNVYWIAVDSSKVASDRPLPEGPTSVSDGFSLYRMVKSFTDKNYVDFVHASNHYPDSLFYSDSENKVLDLQNQFSIIDPDKIDTVVIMYSLQDYYATVPTLTLDEEQVNSYYGALYTSVKLIQDTYPHINIVISSPTQSYLIGEDGTIIYADRTDYGFGNSSAYIDMMYFVATKCCVSFIDNYFYKITDDNIAEYVQNLLLTDKGIDLVATHIANFLLHPESTAQSQ